jgi:hypothetical protein
MAISESTSQGKVYFSRPVVTTYLTSVLGAAGVKHYASAIDQPIPVINESYTPVRHQSKTNQYQSYTSHTHTHTHTHRHTPLNLMKVHL